MRGRVLGWDNNSNQGQISGDDGVRYNFNRPDWRESYWPQRGQVVDFEGSSTQASNIFVMAGASGGGAAAGPKDKTTAALLAFFLGGLGIHKFYLGKTGAALTMLLISLFGWILLFLPNIVIGIIAFVEFIIYLTMTEEEFQRKYVQGNQSWF